MLYVSSMNATVKKLRFYKNSCRSTKRSTSSYCSKRKTEWTAELEIQIGINKRYKK